MNFEVEKDNEFNCFDDVTLFMLIKITPHRRILDVAIGATVFVQTKRDLINSQCSFLITQGYLRVRGDRFY